MQVSNPQEMTEAFLANLRLDIAGRSGATTPDERFLTASREELEAVPGIPGKLARDIHAYVNKIR